MADEVLSQAEVESLLNALESGGPKSDADAAAESSYEKETRVLEKVTLYDFKRPERVGKEQMRALQIGRAHV